jgi:hypothetical protein
MLQGLVHYHYFINQKNNSQIPILKWLCDIICNYFEGEEYCHRILEYWNTLILRKIMNRVENSRKINIDYLKLLILELRQVQNSLNPNLQIEKLLHCKIIDVC